MKYIVIFLIHLFRLIQWPLQAILISVFGFVSTCHQNPSCTQYTISEIRKHGTITGLKRGLNRILSCHRYASDR